MLFVIVEIAKKRLSDRGMALLVLLFGLFYKLTSVHDHMKRVDLKKGCVGGIMVSIAAFQAVDPGSIPGRRSQSFCDAPLVGCIVRS